MRLPKAHIFLNFLDVIYKKLKLNYSKNSPFIFKCGKTESGVCTNKATQKKKKPVEHIFVKESGCRASREAWLCPQATGLVHLSESCTEF